MNRRPLSRQEIDELKTKLRTEDHKAYRIDPIKLNEFWGSVSPGMEDVRTENLSDLPDLLVEYNNKWYVFWDVSKTWVYGRKGHLVNEYPSWDLLCETLDYSLDCLVPVKFDLTF